LDLLESEAQGWLHSRSAEEGQHLLRAAAARYVGQGHELAITLPPGDLDEAVLRQVVDGFHVVHEDHHGYVLPDQAVELVDLAVTAIVESPHAIRRAVTVHDGPTRPPDRQPVFTPETGRLEDCPVEDRRDLGDGVPRTGPLVIRQYDATTFVAPGYCALADSSGNLSLRAVREKGV
jgi:N-methylhydantoinase A